ncbi:MAG: RNA methyltransferase [Tepidimonas sp.]|uniref:RNA methyltransferase n=1 Tax=Tepidimonas sp. TaxID=2002775 RepID=UPI00298EF6C7|nr:RNA methyltransferase [Tepidimonas sp.]MDW8336272.1 RNA methyltransferase [Tepidimonas sp.]
MRTRFVLVEPSHAGNVGAVARAMKVMGFADLALVRPRWPDVLQRPEAVERASGAVDVLQQARVVATLDEALTGISHVCTTAMTPRDFGPPVAAPRPYLAALAPHALAGGESGVAFVFGPERYGLSNADVYRSHVCLRIPTAADYGSLNLAAAVQLIAYEWRLALGGFGAEAAAGPSGPRRAPPADAPALSGLLDHWREALLAVGYLDAASPKKLMARLRLLVQRAAPTATEVHILRGVARAVIEAARRHSG